VVNAAFSVQGVFSPVSVGAFVAILVPWTVNTAIPNTAATIAAPAAIAPGAVTISAKTSGRGAIVTGAVTQAGQPRGGATVTVLGGSAKAKLTTRKRVKVSASGKFAAKFAAGTFFRSDAVATGAAAAPLCTQLQPLIGATPCVNPTVNGFTAKSAIVRKKK
jgi:hypothetical protein